MKIIAVDNLCRDSVSDILITENVNSFYAEAILKNLNDELSTENELWDFKLVEDNYELYVAKKSCHEDDKEIWKDIQCYEGLYIISNLGTIVSLPGKKRGKRISDGHTMSTSKSAVKDVAHPYQKVILTNDGKSRWEQVHRLVAKHFIPNPYNHRFVKFLDKDVANVKASNLYWSDRNDSWDAETRPGKTTRIS